MMCPKFMLADKPDLSGHWIINYGFTSTSVMSGSIPTASKEDGFKQIAGQQIFPVTFLFLTGI